MIFVLALDVPKPAGFTLFQAKAGLSQAEFLKPAVLSKARFASAKHMDLLMDFGLEIAAPHFGPTWLALDVPGRLRLQVYLNN